MLMTSPRRLRDEYSAEMTLVATRMPPMPRPVTIRHSPSWFAGDAVADMKRPIALTLMASTIMLLRTIRSDTGARISTPAAMAKGGAVMTRHRVERERKQSRDAELGEKGRARSR